MIRNASSSERSQELVEDRASMSAMTGRVFSDGGRLGAEKRKRLVEATAAAISLNCSS
jgi:hypothetical protein